MPNIIPEDEAIILKELRRKLASTSIAIETSKFRTWLNKHVTDKLAQAIFHSVQLEKEWDHYLSKVYDDKPEFFHSLGTTERLRDSYDLIYLFDTKMWSSLLARYLTEREIYEKRAFPLIVTIATFLQHRNDEEMQEPFNTLNDFFEDMLIPNFDVQTRILHVDIGACDLWRKIRCLLKPGETFTSEIEEFKNNDDFPFETLQDQGLVVFDESTQILTMNTSAIDAFLNAANSSVGQSASATEPAQPASVSSIGQSSLTHFSSTAASEKEEESEKEEDSKEQTEEKKPQGKSPTKQ